MTSESTAKGVHIECTDVNETLKESKENESISEPTCDSGVETIDTSSVTFTASDSEVSPLRNQLNQVEIVGQSKTIDVALDLENSPQLSPIPTSPDVNGPTNNLHCFNEHSIRNNDIPAKDIVTNNTSVKMTTSRSNDHIDETYNQIDVQSTLATSSMSLDEQKHDKTPSDISKSLFSRSAENILSAGNQSNEQNSPHSSNKELNADQILSQFTSQKNKVSAVQKIPDQNNRSTNIDAKYARIPKELLSQDIGSIVKNVHGIFSTVSGSLKNAYTHRSVQKPIKNMKNIPNGKLMNDIFEDESPKPGPTLAENTDRVVEHAVNPNSNLECSIDQEPIEPESQTKKEVLRLQVEALEGVLVEQRRENTSLRDRVKQQMDELQEKDCAFKDFEAKLDLLSKRVEQAEREKDAAVMRYASVECAAIEARRAADTAAKGQKDAAAEVELLHTKLKSAHAEKHRICQMYDDKCHELLGNERELAKVREDVKELEGRLKWTQSKLRMEMDAYKETAERADKLSQQVAELETAREAAATNATDSIKAKQLEAELKESQAALILCRHEKEDLERRLATATQQLDTCRGERDRASDSLCLATAEVSSLRASNLRLEEEAAELAAMAARAALVDTLTTQLERESQRALQAEEALSEQRALAETCSRREAAALEHAASLTAHHVAQRAHAHTHEAKAQALEVECASLRAQAAALRAELGALAGARAEDRARRDAETWALARRVAELTEEAAEANKKLEWEKGENGVLKKKHASAIKELNRELQRALKRCEQLEAKLPPPDAASTRTGSVTSLSSGESAPPEEHNGHADGLPDIQVREPDRQALIERIVSLQRAAARRSERCEFLEEHSRQLTAELRNKARLLRHLLCSLPAGAVASPHRDANKKEMARLGGGAMAALWGGETAGLSLELALEMASRLQAVLEDTLLKNITLKENMDTLGEEISRLKQQGSTSDAK